MKKQIQEHMKEAMKAGDSVKTGALRMLLASITNKEKDLPANEARNRELTDEQVQQVIGTEAKKRKEAAEAFSAHGGSASGGEKERIENAIEKELKELEILQAYLPEQMPEEEIRKLVQEAVSKTGAANAQDMGKVMAELMPKVRGKADGAFVSSVVKELLGN